MKFTPLLAALIGFTPLAASAMELRIAATTDPYTCVGNGMSRVAYRNDPGNCCDGRVRCAQLLSTQGMVRGKGSNRT